MIKAALVALILFLAGVGVGRGTAPFRTLDLTPLVDKLTDIEAKTSQLATSKCMVVNTSTLTLDVYSMPNLGSHKVPKGGKPKSGENPEETKVTMRENPETTH